MDTPKQSQVFKEKEIQREQRDKENKEEKEAKERKGREGRRKEENIN